jgi:hypothetical protein
MIVSFLTCDTAYSAVGREANQCSKILPPAAEIEKALIIRSERQGFGVGFLVGVGGGLLFVFCGHM